MPALKMPYGEGVVDVSDEAAAAYLAQGWTRVAETVHPAEPKPVPPPQGGPGSSARVWVQYKLDLGIAEPDDSTLTRDELIERIAAAGFPVDQGGS